TNAVRSGSAGELTGVESRSKKDSGYYALIITAIGSGLLSLFTPCVYPMLPVTVAFFLKQEEKKAGSSLVLAIVYSLSMVIAFTIFGVGMSFLFGASSANVVANNPWLNLFFAAVFMAFALMFFGVFEIHVPSWLLTWTSKREASGGLIGVVFMALTFTLVSFTCTFAFVGQIAILAQGGSIFKAIVGMVAFGATFASPFFLLAMFPSVLSRMPRSGGWMNRVKVTIGLVELAMVLKFLSVADIGFSSNGLPVFLDRASFLVGWMAISVVTGFYLLGLFRLTSDMEVKGVPVLQVLLSIMFFAVGGYIGVGLFASTPPSGWVWGQIVAMAPPDFQTGTGTSHGGGKQAMTVRKDDVFGSVVEHHGLVFGLDFDRAVAEATRSGMPLFIDFTGVNCPNCRNMEHDVLSQPQMISLLSKMVRVQLYTDTVPGVENREERDRILEFNRNLQEQWFKDSSLPGYAVATSDGKTVLAEFAGYDNSRGVDFERFLTMGLKQFEKLAQHRPTELKPSATSTAAME
ncbi:MAG: protein-disulfide reductase DsbD family protein, partial [Planctomycetota bacterium]